MGYTTDVDILKSHFFERRSDFNKFKNIDEDKINEIKELVNKELPTILLQQKRTIYSRPKLIKAIGVLTYLTNFNQIKNMTYDERCVFLIQALDPELFFYKSYKAFEDEILALTEPSEYVAHQEWSKEKKRLTQKYKENISKELGIFDIHFLELEKFYFKRLVEKKELVMNIKKNYLPDLIDILKDATNLSSITENRYNEIANQVRNYLSTFRDLDINTISYNILYQGELLNLNTLEEKIIFLILAIDAKLLMLEIYENECKWDNIERLSKEELGFFDKSMIKLEKLYHKQFVPTCKNEL